MSAVEAAVRDAGGTLDVTTKRGEGTKVTISVPKGVRPSHGKLAA